MKTTKKTAQKRTKTVKKAKAKKSPAKKRLRKTNKHFFVVSALCQDSSALGNLKRFDTEAEATQHAAEIIQLRATNGRHQLDFYVLKVVAKVGVPSLPISIERM
jgi:hypothetical protein